MPLPAIAHRNKLDPGVDGRERESSAHDVARLPDETGGWRRRRGRAGARPRAAPPRRGWYRQSPRAEPGTRRADRHRPPRAALRPDSAGRMRRPGTRLRTRRRGTNRRPPGPRTSGRSRAGWSASSNRTWCLSHCNRGCARERPPRSGARTAQLCHHCGWACARGLLPACNRDAASVGNGRRVPPIHHTVRAIGLLLVRARRIGRSGQTVPARASHPVECTPTVAGLAPFAVATGGGHRRYVDHREISLRRSKGRADRDREAVGHRKVVGDRGTVRRRDAEARSARERRTAGHGGESGGRQGDHWSVPETGTTGAGVAGRTW